jgi:hypothetical protein
MRQFVDQHDFGAAIENAVRIELFKRDAAIDDRSARQDFEIADLRLSFTPPVGFHETDHDIVTLIAEPVAFFEHRVRLADTGRGAEEDAEATTSS